MAEEKFVCAACGKEYDRESAVVECRDCHRQYCEECMSAEGVCVPCGEKKTE